MNKVKITKREIVIFSIVSIIFLLIPFIAAPNFSSDQSIFKTGFFKRMLFENILLLVFFLVNYFVLIPKLYFQKRYFFYIVILIIFFLSIPRIGTENWQNGIYESLVIIFVFPFIVYLGASGEIKGKTTQKISQFLGDISYPVYIIHYPFIYVFSSYVVVHKLSMAQSIPAALLVLFGSILTAYLSLKLYDIPLRKWLTKKFV